MSLLLLLTVVAISLAPVAINAKPNTQFATGGLIIGLSEPGTANCIGGTPSGWFFPPCSLGTKLTIWRNFVGPHGLDNVTGGAAPFLPETWVVRGSCNLDENLTGPCWGTFEGDALGGKWEGTLNGKLDFTRFGGYLNFVGHGSGGGVEGLHMKLEAAMEDAGDPAAPMPFTARVYKIEE